MTEIQNTKPKYDLEERTFAFAKSVRLFVKTLPTTVANMEDGKQLIKSSGSIGANYCEANEVLSKKDFLMRIKISRKEAKESHYWLRLIYETNSLQNAAEAERLIQEANELKIFFLLLLRNQNSEWKRFGYLDFVFGNYLIFAACKLSFTVNLMVTLSWFS